MKVKNYGDLISQMVNKPLLAYIEFGSYQGEYITVLEDGDNIELWRGSYGSCYGCDWLEAALVWDEDYKNRSITDEQAKDFMKDEKSFATIPKETATRVDPETLASMLPANIREDMWDFDPVIFANEIKEALQDNK